MQFCFLVDPKEGGRLASTQKLLYVMTKDILATHKMSHNAVPAGVDDTFLIRSVNYPFIWMNIINEFKNEKQVVHHF